MRSRSAILRFALAAAAIAAGFAVGYVSTRHAPPSAEPPFGAMGWHDDPVAVEHVVATTRRLAFSATPAGQVAAELPKAVYLWEAHRRITGQNPQPRDQGDVGSCVSQGTSRAIERTMAAQILAGQPFELLDLVEEAIYGGSRVEVGGGRIRGDGSVGAWAAEFVRRWGVVSRGVHGRYDLTRYSVPLCKEWGSRGVPDEIEEIARRHPVRDTARVTTWAEAKRAIAQGHGIAVCSSQGFERQRDARGVCRPRGVWYHCMAIDGYHVDVDGREYGRIENSWGPDYHVGPVGWGNPNTGGFWAESSVIERMLKQGDSWAFSAVEGFPAKAINWDLLLGRADPVGWPAAVKHAIALGYAVRVDDRPEDKRHRAVRDLLETGWTRHGREIGTYAPELAP